MTRAEIEREIAIIDDAYLEDHEDGAFDRALRRALKRGIEIGESRKNEWITQGFEAARKTKHSKLSANPCFHKYRTPADYLKTLEGDK